MILNDRVSGRFLSFGLGFLFTCAGVLKLIMLPAGGLDGTWLAGLVGNSELAIVTLAATEVFLGVALLAGLGGVWLPVLLIVGVSLTWVLALATTDVQQHHCGCFGSVSESAAASPSEYVRAALTVAALVVLAAFRRREARAS